MHPDTQINRLLIAAMLAEYRGQLARAVDLVTQAAALQIDRFGGPPGSVGARGPGRAARDAG